ncbi:MAG: hypothetical protein IJS12_10500 [Lachnospiraceae bacterium]|nr:hypothetical protein [Lachnospiraceae bacterium]
MISVLLRLVIPLIYCLVMGGGFSYIARKRFSVSLAPAFMLHALFTTVIAIITESVNAGIITGIAAMIAAVIITVILRRRAGADISYEIRLDEILFFLIIYLLIWALNYDKCFRNPDEFSHWGWFVREIIRTDKLYCASDLPIVHKDYVPAVSVFEAIWCRLSFQYSEPNAYRGIQMLAASMMIPICLSPNTGKKVKPAEIVGIICRFIIVFGIPILYVSDFYHTLYQDLLLGIIVAYCIYTVLSESPNYGILFIALCMLALSKMTALAFIPMIVIFYGVYTCCNNQTGKLRVILRCLVMTGIPIVPWIIYNSYMRRYLPYIGAQSYDSISLTDIVGVITHNGIIPYQTDVEQTYFTYLGTYGVVDKAPYIVLLTILMAVLYIWSWFVDDHSTKFTIRLTTLWIFLAGIAYVIMMYVLYLTQFSEYEARQLASYGRYMSTYLLAATMIGASLFTLYTPLEKLSPALSLTAVLSLTISIAGLGSLDQIMPGFVEFGGIASADKTKFGSEIDFIIDNIDAGSSIYILNRGLMGDNTATLSYYLTPDYDICNSYASPGSPAYEGEIYSQPTTVQELFDRLSSYDYLLIAYVDDIFMQEYSDIFTGESPLEKGIYRIKSDGQHINLTRVYS